MFFVNIPIAVVGFAVAAASVRESRDEGARAFDPVGSVWHASLSALPEMTRAQAPRLIQQVAGAEARAVAAVLGPSATTPALDAFISGYGVAVTVAGILLLVGGVAFSTLGQKADRAHP